MKRNFRRRKNFYDTMAGRGLYSQPGAAGLSGEWADSASGSFHRPKKPRFVRPYNKPVDAFLRKMLRNLKKQQCPQGDRRNRPKLVFNSWARNVFLKPLDPTELSPTDEIITDPRNPGFWRVVEWNELGKEGTSFSDVSKITQHFYFGSHNHGDCGSAGYDDDYEEEFSIPDEEASNYESRPPNGTTLNVGYAPFMRDPFDHQRLWVESNPSHTWVPYIHNLPDSFLKKKVQIFHFRGQNKSDNGDGGSSVPNEVICDNFT